MSEDSKDWISAAEAAARALEAQDGGSPVALVTVIAAPVDEAVGRRLVVTESSRNGSLGSADLDARAAREALDVMRDRGRSLREVEGEKGVWQLYIESQHPVPELLIVGAGHIARPLCRIASLLGFAVTVIDDRPEYADTSWFPEAERVLVVDFNDTFARTAVTSHSHVVLVTRGHKYDYDCIQQLLETNVRPAYLGMIGSRRRVRATFEALVRDGVPPERLADVRAPIGLDIGAETPEEIAVSIAAEIVAVRRGGGGGSLTREEGVLDRVAKKRSPNEESD